MRNVPLWRHLILILIVCGGLAPLPALARPSTTAPTTSGSVPMYRGGPARTGENPGPGPIGTPVPRWTTWLGFLISSSPAVVDGVAYIGSSSPVNREGGALHAVDLATGHERWRLSTIDGDGFFSSPAVAGGIVCIGSYYGFVLAADAATGEERWRFQAAGEVNSSPAIVDGVVYVGDLDGNLFALDAATGEERWRVAFDRPYDHYVNVSPAVVDGTVYVVVGSRRPDQTIFLLAVDAATGTERWRFVAEKDGVLRGTVAVADGTAYVSTAEGILYAVDTATGRERWHVDVKAPIAYTNPAVANGIAYLATSNGDLYAVDAATGQERWSRRLTRTSAFISSPAIAGGTVYLGNGNGILYAVDAGSGKERWHVDVGSFLSSPAVVGGFIYVGTDDGKLLALGDPEDEPFGDNRAAADTPAALSPG